MGANACRGRVRGAAVVLDDGGEVTAAEAATAPDGAATPDGAAALAVIPAHAVTLHRDQPDGSARNRWPVLVRDLTATGSRVRVRCEGSPSVVAEVTPSAVAALDLVEGARMWAAVKATEVTIVPL
jgi:molybdate transport system permease protein